MPEEEKKQGERKGRGWHGDSEGHARAARMRGERARREGGQEKRGGEGREGGRGERSRSSR